VNQNMPATQRPRRSTLTRRRLLAGAALSYALPMHAQTADPSNPDQVLIRAAARGDEAEVRRLLAAGAGVTARDEHKRTALLAATQGNHVAVAALLIGKGADVNAQDDMQDSAFLLAGASGYLEIVRLCLAAGADLKSRNRYGGTALIPACHHGHLATVRELLKTRIDVNHVNNLGWTALLEAVILGDGGRTHTEIVRELITHGAQVNLADREGVTPLAHARRRGYREMAGLLEAAGGR
jgi:ankyrin repeat protein